MILFTNDVVLKNTEDRYTEKYNLLRVDDFLTVSYRKFEK